MKRDDIILSGVIAIGASASAFSLIFMTKFGVKQEALFSLVGAFIGAAASVSGAAWVVDRNRALDRDSEVDLLLSEIEKLLRKSLNVQSVEPAPGLLWPKEYRPLLRELAEHVGNVHALCGEALTHAKALTFVHRVAVRRVQFAINEYLSFWDDSNDERDLDESDDRSFPQVTAEITDQCKLAIAELKGVVPLIEQA